MLSEGREQPLLMLWTAPATGIAMCPIPTVLEERRESAHGYERKFRGVRQNVRSYSESRRSRANVRFPTDLVCFAPRSRPS